MAPWRTETDKSRRLARRIRNGSARRVLDTLMSSAVEARPLITIVSMPRLTAVWSPGLRRPASSLAEPVNPCWLTPSSACPAPGRPRGSHEAVPRNRSLREGLPSSADQSCKGGRLSPFSRCQTTRPPGWPIPRRLNHAYLDRGFWWMRGRPVVCAWTCRRGGNAWGDGPRQADPTRSTPSPTEADEDQSAALGAGLIPQAFVRPAGAHDGAVETA